MRLTQKLRLAALLCLSIVMVVISAIRMTACAHHSGLTDATWSYFWMYLESCAAITMASISAIRPLFVNRGRVIKADEKEKNKFPPPFDQERLLQNNKGVNRVGWEDMGREGLPTAPLASLTRIHRFLYNDGRLTEGTTSLQSMSHSADEGIQSYVLLPSTKENLSSVGSNLD